MNNELHTRSVLVPISDAAFPAFLEAAVAGYAEQNVASGRWPADTALALSGAEHERLLPEGARTEDNHIFEIQDRQSRAVVGVLWLAVQNKNGVRLGYVLNIEIADAHRRQGHATSALKALESVVRELGLSSIGLNVFGYNTSARALYASLGYEVSALSMRKILSDEDDHPAPRKT